MGGDGNGLHNPEEWNVCARGPSLVSVTDNDLLNGACIAVNSAIYHEPVVFQFWAGVDSPQKYADPMKPEHGRKPPWGDSDPPKVISKVSQAGWREYYPELECIAYPQQREKQAEMLPWKKSKIPWCHWTTLLAIFHAVVNGAKRIRVLGADMRGDRYFRPSGPGNLSENRWQRERTHFEQAVAECKEGGVEVERYFPPGWKVT